MTKPLKEIYIVQVDGRAAAFGCEQGNPEHFYSFCPKDEFINWVKSLKEKYPDFSMHCVKNDGIVEWLKKRKIQLTNYGKENY